MKLLRVVATSGRHACARLVGSEVLLESEPFGLLLLEWVLIRISLFASLLSFQLNSFGVTERLSRLLSSEPGELLLEQSEAVRITAEAYRLWAVAAGYGQASKLYMSVNMQAGQMQIYS